MTHLIYYISIFTFPKIIHFFQKKIDREDRISYSRVNNLFGNGDPLKSLFQISTDLIAYAKIKNEKSSLETLQTYWNREFFAASCL